jgi:Kef-type K+ transport system membrane component KefB
MNIYTIAAVWVALALVASVVSIRAGIAVALGEILVGALAGNLPGVGVLLQQTE